jgi:phosphoglycolate phosphatase-like HAD superfamily hydrolase
VGGMTQARRTIFWDFNCTLTDEVEILLAAVNKTLLHWWADPITLEQYQRLFAMPIEQGWENAGLAPAITQNNLSDLTHIFHQHYSRDAHSVPLRPYTKDILAATAAHVEHVIVSNHIAPQIEAQLARYEIRDYFNTILAYPSVQEQFQRETKGEKLARHMQEQRLNPADCLIIGDTQEETHIARTYNITSIAITGGNHSEPRLRAVQPDHVVHDLQGFHQILRTMQWVA